MLVPEMTVKARSIAAMVSSVAALAALACSACDGPDSTGKPRAPGTLTFNRDIAPIVFAACARCHHPRGSGPFSLITYRDVKKRAQHIVDVTSTRFMPPWLPEPGDHQFVAQRRLVVPAQGHSCPRHLLDIAGQIVGRLPQATLAFIDSLGQDDAPERPAVLDQRARKGLLRAGGCDHSHEQQREAPGEVKSKSL